MRTCGFWGVMLALLCAAPCCGQEALMHVGLGVNIHFTDPKPGEMKMLAEAGFRWIRMDFAWNGTEREKGKYDFSAYDRLMKTLDEHKMNALFILDYSNRHYDNGLSPQSDEGRKAFAQWAAAAVRHFKGRNIVWEMYNEPNIFFWRPKPDVNQYVKLALEVGKAIREAAPPPDAVYIGPATSGVDFAFLEECFKAGLLEYFGGVTVHPYRQEAPETVAADYARLRRMIRQYAPKDKQIPILSGEWGYSAAWQHFDETRQGKYLPRQMLTNRANDIRYSIWYDWHDDGTDPKEPEHHFGTVRNAYRAGADPVYEPKPAYRAAKTLSTVLAGCLFNKRLVVGGQDDYVLLFYNAKEVWTSAKDVRVVAWTTAAKPHAVVIPASPGKFRVTGHTGEELPAVTADNSGLALTLTDAPQYLVPEAPNDLLSLAVAWQRAPLEIELPAQKKARVSQVLFNPLSRPIRVASGPGDWVEMKPKGQHWMGRDFDLSRAADPLPVRLECRVEGMGSLVQETHLVCTNPLRVTLLPPAEKALWARVENPQGAASEDVISLANVEGLQLVEAKQALVFRQGEKEKTVQFPLARAAAASYRAGVRVENRDGEASLTLPPAGYCLVDDFAAISAEKLAEAYQLVPDGDRNVASTQSLALAAPPEGPPLPGVKTLKIAYDFAAGWKFIRLVPQKDDSKKIDGRPQTLGLWLYGDGSGNHPRLRFTDATGQTFQPNGEPIKWQGWRYILLPLDGTRSGHWGGANDGVIHYPIHWDTLLLVDSAGRQKTQGEIYIGAPVLISELPR